MTYPLILVYICVKQDQKSFIDMNERYAANMIVGQTDRRTDKQTGWFLYKNRWMYSNHKSTSIKANNRDMKISLFSLFTDTIFKHRGQTDDTKQKMADSGSGSRQTKTDLCKTVINQLQIKSTIETWRYHHFLCSRIKYSNKGENWWQKTENGKSLIKQPDVQLS